MLAGVITKPALSTTLHLHQFRPNEVLIVFQQLVRIAFRLVIRSVARKVTLAPSHTQRDIFQALLARRRAYHSLSCPVPQHEIDQMTVPP